MPICCPTICARIEWLKGSPLSMRAQMVGQQIGILALILLMSFAFYNDIARILVE